MDTPNDHHPEDPHAASPGGLSGSTSVLDVRGMQFASEGAVVESVLGRLDGVTAVEANPLAQTATVTFDRARTSIAELRRRVEECGYHCAGESLPNHVCPAAIEPSPTHGHNAGHDGDGNRTAQDVMGHGGHHGAMSMEGMVIGPPLYEDADHARDRIARMGWIERQLAFDTPSAATACRLVCDHREAAAALTALARPGMPAIIRRGGVQHTWASYAGTFRSLLAPANGDRWLAEVECPVTLIAGTRDGITDLDHLAALAEKHPHVTLEVQPNADHSLPLTHPAVCVDAIVKAQGAEVW